MSTIKISELATSSINLEDFIIKSDNLGIATKNTVQVLSNVLSTVGDSQFRGSISISDTPTLDGWYFAEQTGTYTNFGGEVVDLANGLTILISSSSFTVFSQFSIPVTQPTESVINEANTSVAVNGKAVFDALGVKADLEAGKNKFNVETMTEDFYVTASGDVVFHISLNHSDYMPVVAGESYISNFNLRRRCYFDDDRNVVAGGSDDQINSGNAFVAPVGATLLIASFFDFDFSLLQIEQSTVLTTFEPYKESLVLNQFPYGIAAQVENSEDLTPIGLIKDYVDKDTLVANNTVLNGNFDSVTGLTPVGGTISVSSNELEFVVTDNNNNLAGFKVDGGVVADHKYFVSISVKPVKSNWVAVGFTFSGFIDKFVKTTTANVWNLVDTVIEPTSTDLLRIIYNVTSLDGYVNGDSVFFKELMFIDLTEMFGAGNEPSADLFRETLDSLSNPFFVGESSAITNSDYYTNFREKGETNKTMILERESIDRIDENTESVNIYKDAVDSLLKASDSSTGEFTVVIPPYDVETNDVVIPIGLHYKANTKGTSYFDEVYFNELCKTDFTDLRIEDSDGNLLDFNILSKGNYDYIKDDNLPFKVHVMSNGYLIGSGLISGNHGVSLSKDNGVTWVNKLNGSNYETWFADSRDYIFVLDSVAVKAYILKIDDDYATPVEITNLTTFLQATEPALRLEMDEDSDNNLYLAKYTAPSVTVIMKSTDGGVTWVQVFFDATVMHNHRIFVDENVVPNVIYIGNDGIIGGANNPKSFKSTDAGATWTLLPIPFNNTDSGIVYSDPVTGYRYGVGECNILGGVAIFRTNDDVNFTKVLDNEFRIQSIERFGSVLIASCLSEYYNRVAQILISYDNGASWSTARAAEWLDKKSVGEGHRLLSKPFIPINETETQIIASNTSFEKPIRILMGGDNYFAQAFVKIGTLPLAGKTIKIKYGSKNEFPQNRIYTDTLLDSDLIFRARLSEGRGNYFKESVSGNYIELTKGTKWDNLTRAYNYGTLLPYYEPFKSSIIEIPFGNGMRVSDVSILPLKNFSVSFWSDLSYRDDGYKHFIIGNELTVSIYYIGTQIFMSDGVTDYLIGFIAGNIHTGMFNYNISVSNDAVPVVSFGWNANKLQTTTLTGWNPSATNYPTYFLGVNIDNVDSPLNYHAPISNFAVYNKELSARDFRDLFYGYKGSEVTDI